MPFQRQNENLALPSAEQQALENVKAGLDTWEYTARNTLMYYPTGEALAPDSAYSISLCDSAALTGKAVLFLCKVAFKKWVFSFFSWPLIPKFDHVLSAIEKLISITEVLVFSSQSSFLVFLLDEHWLSSSFIVCFCSESSLDLLVCLLLQKNTYFCKCTFLFWL